MGIKMCIKFKLKTVYLFLGLYIIVSLCLLKSEISYSDESESNDVEEKEERNFTPRCFPMARQAREATTGMDLSSIMMMASTTSNAVAQARGSAEKAYQGHAIIQTTLSGIALKRYAACSSAIKQCKTNCYPRCREAMEAAKKARAAAAATLAAAEAAARKAAATVQAQCNVAYEGCEALSTKCNSAALQAVMSGIQAAISFANAKKLEGDKDDSNNNGGPVDLGKLEPPPPGPDNMPTGPDTPPPNTPYTPPGPKIVTEEGGPNIPPPGEVKKPEEEKASEDGKKGKGPRIAGNTNEFSPGGVPSEDGESGNPYSSGGIPGGTNSSPGPGSGAILGALEDEDGEEEFDETGPVTGGFGKFAGGDHVFEGPGGAHRSGRSSRGRGKKALKDEKSDTEDTVARDPLSESDSEVSSIFIQMSKAIRSFCADGGRRCYRKKK